MPLSPWNINQIPPSPQKTRTTGQFQVPQPPKTLKHHRRSKYHRLVPRDGGIVIGDSGVLYLLPTAPFEFQFDYSKTSKVKPIAIHELSFPPFVPPTMSRSWTEKAPLKGKKSKKVPHCPTTSTSTTRFPLLLDSTMMSSSLSTSLRASYIQTQTILH